ncbi:hypothetical protein HanXRQr2_Chr13g0581811 [Helianthus annuus]|uniref:Uncharacterized protein n=1 Tax=Helianthus annuus TaxID=4232 RepID=A0A9K3EFB5_HELAN|nr:hypothetical protein HanXRQr2_Chr13g0581811 [Helianthus annuus]KAJ0895570.1 hypothetical protein HanPSC8_Chr09g0402091 [Helianthus annuus]
MGMVVSPLVLPHLHRSQLKTRGCYLYRHQLSALKRSLLMQIRIQKKQLTVTHMKVGW